MIYGKNCLNKKKNKNLFVTNLSILKKSCKMVRWGRLPTKVDSSSNEYLNDFEESRFNI